MAEPCAACGGTLDWFDSVHAWRHTSVPPDTAPHQAVRMREDYVQPVPEADPLTAEPVRITETREQVEARGRAMMAAAAAWNAEHPYERPRVRVAPAEVVLDPLKVHEHPKPEVCARPAHDDELPSAALRVRELLVEWGWTTDQQYARGWKPDVHRRVSHTKLVEVVVVRGLRRAMSEMIVACWTDGKYDSGYWRVPGGTSMISSTDLKIRIKTPVMHCEQCGANPNNHAEEPCAA